MSISKERFKGIAETFLAILEREGISSLQGLERKLGGDFALGTDCNDHLSLESRPSNQGTVAYTLSYIAPGLGIPIEVRINPALGNSTLIIKAGYVFQTYWVFAEDLNDNLIQYKTIDSIAFPQIVEELTALSKSFK